MITKSIIFLFFIVLIEDNAAQSPVYPESEEIESISFDYSSLVEHAPGSDNWAITWADDDHQYTTWGDGGGFGGTDSIGRVSLGFARIEGSHDNYTGYNIWGGYNAANPAEFEGKSYGIICIDGILWMWRTGNGSDETAFDLQELYKSTNHGATWQYANVRFNNSDFNGFPKFYAVTFCQFGKDYEGARDNYVYMYAPETFNEEWDVQYPGRITLMRVLKAELDNESAYEFFTGVDSTNTPSWSSDIHQRNPVFSDSVNGVMRTSVSYNPGLQKYFLITQQVSRWQAENGHIGIYEASEPWGPWFTVLFENAWDINLQTGSKTVFWNFSNKWLRENGTKFTLVMTGNGPDNWGTIDGEFTVSLPVELNSFTHTVNGNNVTLSWVTSSELNNQGFEIQRAQVINNIRKDNITIGTVEGKGTTTAISEYSFTDKNLDGGTYLYRLIQKDFNGEIKIINLDSEVNIDGKINFLLEQNYPNPFNPATEINITLQESGHLRLTIYNLLGETVKVLEDSFLESGKHKMVWNGKNMDGKDVPSGLYFYEAEYLSLSGNKINEVKKMLLIK